MCLFYLLSLSCIGIAGQFHSQTTLPTHLCRYSIIYPVSPSNTAPDISQNNFTGNFCKANCLGVAGLSVSSTHESITSWVSVLRLALVFSAVVLPLLFEILFGFGCESICGIGGDVTTFSFSPTSSLSGFFSYGGEWDGVFICVTLCGVTVFSLTLCGGGSLCRLSL